MTTVFDILEGVCGEAKLKLCDVVIERDGFVLDGRDGCNLLRSPLWMAIAMVGDER